MAAAFGEECSLPAEEISGGGGMEEERGRGGGGAVRGGAAHVAGAVDQDLPSPGVLAAHVQVEVPQAWAALALQGEALAPGKVVCDELGEREEEGRGGK